MTSKKAYVVSTPEETAAFVLFVGSAAECQAFDEAATSADPGANGTAFGSKIGPSALNTVNLTDEVLPGTWVVPAGALYTPEE